ncbi:amidase [Aureimonas jatrophae]|uniref:Indoleacetamide hydrolase n=1 Tax=Aureimonas jatrophae TaxID=1166073 RepID=A0A1H0FAK2_9HYPH|nr:amidase [Aureimonas jatrophae]MBB3950103.1 aspartyl-tRNA(Asn)/glutamyl-tRNA(Gln) amidotransferase subunit A [Aureimonas jatrophae]SDN91675.1 aspartyl/glutamyl-tRNA(Asn/Gln) amidotransferase subunit A [Aureimonas jatrophae]
MTQQPAFPSVTELGRALRQGTTTSAAVVREALERIEALDGRLNAFADAMAEAALAEAEQRDAERRAGRVRGPLHGIPVAIKDIIDVAGTPTGWGTRAHPPRIAARDAELVRRLREAGAVILGKTNCLEYAYGVAHPAVGQTNNPLDPSRTAGGSSGGSAAAVAAGIVPLSIGTDTGGSIRIPASYCGIVGLKPSLGLVSLDGVFPLSPTLDHAGPLARSVADAALALACLTGRPITLHPVPLQGLRIGLVRHHFEAPVVSSGVRASVDQVLARLEEAGATLTQIDLPGIREVNQALVEVLLPEAALVHAERHAANAAGYAPGTRAQIEAGFASRGIDYLRALTLRRAITLEADRCFDRVDVLVSPSVPFVAPAEDPPFVEGEEGELLASGLANMTGQPSISLGCGWSEQLPVGLQLTGRTGCDARLLSIASAIETIG